MFFIVSIGQKSNMGLTRSTSRCWPGCIPYQRLWGRITFKFTQFLSNLLPSRHGTEARFLAGCGHGVAGIPWLVAPFLPSNPATASQVKNSSFDFPFDLLSCSCFSHCLLSVWSAFLLFQAHRIRLGPTE